MAESEQYPCGTCRQLGPVRCPESRRLKEIVARAWDAGVADKDNYAAWQPWGDAVRAYYTHLGGDTAGEEDVS